MKNSIYRDAGHYVTAFLMTREGETDYSVTSFLMKFGRDSYSSTRNSEQEIRNYFNPGTLFYPQPGDLDPVEIVGVIEHLFNILYQFPVS